MSVKHLWAPWRMEYLVDPKEEKKRTEMCIFCTLPAETEDRKNLILFRGPRAFAILNRFPYNSGHLMVVPNAHVNHLNRLDPEDWRAVGELTQASIRILQEVYKTDGFNIGMNIGEAGGAGIRGHIHQHLVPRWNGDTNFMPVIGETKAMPQHLLTTYDLLADSFAKL